MGPTFALPLLASTQSSTQPSSFQMYLLSRSTTYSVKPTKAGAWGVVPYGEPCALLATSPSFSLVDDNKFGDVPARVNLVPADGGSSTVKKRQDNTTAQ